MSTVTIYCRVSTTQQADHGISLEAQEARIRAWAAANGHTVSAVHADRGITGTRTDIRPGLAAALDAVCASGGLLVVASLSRLARSTRDAIDIAARLDKAGAGLASLTEAIDTSTAHGRFVFKLLASLAEMEAEITAERTRAAMAHLRAQGRRISGNVPFGHDADADGALVPNAAEQAVLADIRQQRAAGASLSGIARRLREAGVPTKAGGRWGAATVRGVLRRVGVVAAG